MLTQLLQTDNHPSARPLIFSNPKKYNNFFQKVCNSKDRTLNSTFNLGVVELNINPRSVRALYYPANELVFHTSHQSIVLFCEDKNVYVFPIKGSNTMKVTWKLFRILVNKEPTEFFITFPQDEKKYGLFRHYSKIKEIEFSK